MATELDRLRQYVPQRITTDLMSKISPDLVSLKFPTCVALKRSCVVVADVSGFTQLNENFSTLGIHGAETVTRHLNQYFSKLLAIVQEHGGDCIKFAGDALIILFTTGEQAPLTHKDRCCWGGTQVPSMKEASELVLTATQCALALLHQVGTYKTQGVTLSLHVFIAYGTVYSLHVGGETNGWEFMAAGTPFAQIASGMPLSQAGEVVVSKEAWELLQPLCDGTVLKTGQAKIQRVKEGLGGRKRMSRHKTSHKLLPARADAGSSPQATAELVAQLGAYVPSCVLRHLASGKPDWMGENRDVSVMFVLLHGLMLDRHLTDGDINRVQAVCSSVMRVIGSNNGYRRQLLVDDKGCTLIVVFGVPPHATEQDAVQALVTAQALRQALHFHGIRHSIGVASGNVYSGSVGSTDRQEHAVVGDIVNLAARLCGRSKKGNSAILCCKVTKDRCPSFLFQDHGKIKVKGKDTTISVSILMGVKGDEDGPGGSTGERGAFLERKRELLEFDKAVDDLQKSGKRAVVMIMGEAGIGKTRVLSAAQQRLKRHSKFLTAVFLKGRVHDEHCLAVWQRIFRRLIAITLSVDLTTAHAKQLKGLPGQFIKLVAPSMKHDSKLINFLSQALSGRVVKVTENADPSLEEDRDTVELEHCVLQCLQFLAKYCQAQKRPLVLFLDTIRSYQGPSARLLASVADSVDPLVLVVASRPATLPRDGILKQNRTHKDLLDQLLNVPDVTSLTLEGLSKTSLAVLVPHYLEATQVDQEVLFFVNRCNGNPLFCIEMARHLHKQGALRVLDGTLSLVDSHKTPLSSGLPESLKGLLTKDIDSLPVAHGLVCKLMSTFGPFGWDMAFLEKLWLNENFGTVEQLHQAVDLLMSQHIVEFGEARSLKNPFLLQSAAYQFHHTMQRSACYEMLLLGQRLKIHSAIGQMLEVRIKNMDVHSNEQSDAVLSYHYTMALRCTVDMDQKAKNPFLGRARQFLEGRGGLCLSHEAAAEVGSLIWELVEKIKQLVEALKAHLIVLLHADYRRGMVRSASQHRPVRTLENQHKSDVNIISRFLATAKGLQNSMTQAASLGLDQEKMELLITTFEGNLMRIFTCIFFYATQRYEEMDVSIRNFEAAQKFQNTLVPKIVARLRKQGGPVAKQMDLLIHDKCNPFVAIIALGRQMRLYMERLAILSLPADMCLKLQHMQTRQTKAPRRSLAQSLNTLHRVSLVSSLPTIGANDVYPNGSRGSDSGRSGRSSSRHSRKTSGGVKKGHRRRPTEGLSAAPSNGPRLTSVQAYDEFLEKTNSLNPNDNYTRRLLLIYEGHMEKTREAEKSCNEVMKEAQSKEEALKNFEFGLKMLEMCELQNAIKFFLKALSMDETQTRFHGFLGQAYHKQGNFEKASEAFFRASHGNQSEEQQEAELKAKVSNKSKKTRAAKKFALSELQALVDKHQDEEAQQKDRYERSKKSYEEQQAELQPYVRQLEAQFERQAQYTRELEAKVQADEKALGEYKAKVLQMRNELAATGEISSSALTLQQEELEKAMDAYFLEKQEMERSRRLLQVQETRVTLFQEQTTRVHQGLDRVDSSLRHLEANRDPNSTVVDLLDDDDDEDEDGTCPRCGQDISRAEALQAENAQLRVEMAALRAKMKEDPPAVVSRRPSDAPKRAPPTRPSSPHPSPPQSPRTLASPLASRTASRSSSLSRPSPPSSTAPPRRSSNAPSRPAPSKPSSISTKNLVPTHARSKKKKYRDKTVLTLRKEHVAILTVLRSHTNTATLNISQPAHRAGAEKNILPDTNQLDRIILQGGDVDRSVWLIRRLQLQGPIDTFQALLRRMKEESETAAKAEAAMLALMQLLIPGKAGQLESADVNDMVGDGSAVGSDPLRCLQSFVKEKRTFRSVDELREAIEGLESRAGQHRAADFKETLHLLAHSTRLFSSVGTFAYKPDDITSIIAAANKMSAEDLYSYGNSQRRLHAVRVLLKNLDARHQRFTSLGELVVDIEITQEASVKNGVDMFAFCEKSSLFAPGSQFNLKDMERFTEVARDTEAARTSLKRWEAGDKHKARFTAVDQVVAMLKAEEEEIVTLLTTGQLLSSGAQIKVSDLEALIWLVGGGPVADFLNKAKIANKTWPFFDDLSDALVKEKGGPLAQLAIASRRGR